MVFIYLDDILYNKELYDALDILSKTHGVVYMPLSTRVNPHPSSSTLDKTQVLISENIDRLIEWSVDGGKAIGLGFLANMGSKWEGLTLIKGQNTEYYLRQIKMYCHIYW